MNVLPFLIAQTPRAGRWNHVTLLPTVALPSGARAEDLLGAAAFNPIGENYLAVVRRVPQAGGTKEGREVLVLVGIDVPDGPQRDRLVQWLDERLKELGTCVAAVDWANHDGSDYRLAILDQWADEARSRFGLTAASGAKLLAAQNAIAGMNAGWNRSLIMDAVIAGIGIVGGVLAWNLFLARP